MSASRSLCSSAFDASSVVITDTNQSCPSMKAILYKKCFAPAR
jgi:hypothetical protein